MGAAAYLAALAPLASNDNPLNLLLFHGRHLMGLESGRQRLVPMEPGIGGVSSADFEPSWPTLLRLKAGLQNHSQTGPHAASALLHLSQHAKPAADAELTHTRVPLKLECRLSAT